VPSASLVPDTDNTQEHKEEMSSRGATLINFAANGKETRINLADTTEKIKFEMIGQESSMIPSLTSEAKVELALCSNDLSLSKLEPNCAAQKLQLKLFTNVDEHKLMCILYLTVYKHGGKVASFRN
jgi:hypothetical protein